MKITPDQKQAMADLDREISNTAFELRQSRYSPDHTEAMEYFLTGKLKTLIRSKIPGVLESVVTEELQRLTGVRRAKLQSLWFRGISRGRYQSATAALNAICAL